MFRMESFYDGYVGGGVLHINIVVDEVLSLEAVDCDSAFIPSGSLDSQADLSK